MDSQWFDEDIKRRLPKKINEEAKAQQQSKVPDWDTNRMDDQRSLQCQRHGRDSDATLRALESRARNDNLPSFGTSR